MSLDKFIHGLKKLKKIISKLKINPKQKIFSSSDVFLKQFQSKKKTPKLNSHNQIESFKTKINRFSGLN